jgi:hypothetical protein
VDKLFIVIRDGCVSRVYAPHPHELTIINEDIPDESRDEYSLEQHRARLKRQKDAEEAGEVIRIF